jgi:hypothetical protein
MKKFWNRFLAAYDRDMMSEGFSIGEKIIFGIMVPIMALALLGVLGSIECAIYH